MPPIAIPAILSKLSIRDFVIMGLVTALLVLATLSFGFSVFGIGIEGWKPKSERLEIDLTNLNKKIDEAEREWAQTFKEIQLSYEAKAEEADENAKQELREASALANEFIARNRVRCRTTGSPANISAGSSQAGAAGNPDGPGESSQLDESLVAVPENDIRICTENTVRLQEARNWALGL